MLAYPLEAFLPLINTLAVTDMCISVQLCTVVQSHNFILWAL